MNFLVSYNVYAHWTFYKITFSADNAIKASIRIQSDSWLDVVTSEAHTRLIPRQKRRINLGPSLDG
jgi:predicted transcriptional regulator